MKQLQITADIFMWTHRGWSDMWPCLSGKYEETRLMNRYGAILAFVFGSLNHFMQLLYLMRIPDENWHQPRVVSSWYSHYWASSIQWKPWPVHLPMDYIGQHLRIGRFYANASFEKMLLYHGVIQLRFATIWSNKMGRNFWDGPKNGFKPSTCVCERTSLKSLVVVPSNTPE